MKKTSIVIIFVIIILLLFAGCSLDLTSGPNYSDYQEALAEAYNLRLFSNIGDFDALMSEINLVANLVTKEDFGVSFVYNCRTSNETYELPEICWENLFSSNFQTHYRGTDNERAWLKAQLIRALYAYFFNNNNVEVDDNGDVIGTIFHWAQTNLWGNKTHYYVCDLDGDGTWDYGSRNPIGVSFTTSPVSDRPCVKVDDGWYMTMSMISGDDYVSLAGLPSDELTTKDLKKAIERR